MNNVWYTAFSGVTGRRYVVRHEWDGELVFSLPLDHEQTCHIPFDWGRRTKGSLALACYLLRDAVGIELESVDDYTVDFLEDVVFKMPLEGWELTEEALCDWWLSGVRIVDHTPSFDQLVSGGDY